MPSPCPSLPKKKRVGVKEEKKGKEHTAPGIRWWSPTQLLVWRSAAYLWESGRDPELSTVYGRMCHSLLVSWLLLGLHS